MNRDIVPLALRRDRSVRVVVLPSLLIVCALHATIAVRPLLVDDGLGAGAAWLLTVGIVALAIATAGSLVVLAVQTSLTQAMPLASRLVAPGLVLPISASLYGLGPSTLGLPRGAALALTCMAAIAMLAAIGRHRHRVKATPLYRLINVGHPQQAEDLIAETRDALRAPSLTSDRRGALELLLASAIADLSVLVDRYDDLAEAERILARSLATGNERALVGAALSLTPAIVARARWTEDVAGLEQGLELVARTMSRVPAMMPMLHRMLLGMHADGLLLLRQHAVADDDMARAADLLGAAIDDLQRALELTRRGSSDRADLMIELAGITWVGSQHGGLDASIDRCRTALRTLRLRRGHMREAGYLTLADLLAERAASEDAPQGPDLAEAIRLCRLVASKGRHPQPALNRLPVLLNASGADESVVAAAFRRGFAALSAVSFDDAAGLAADWACWAEARCYTTEAAEAHLCWIRTVVTESQRLRLRGEQHRPRWAIQGLTADAGFWLLAAGRRRDAALTLELGCSVDLTDRLHRARGDVAKRLAAAGREDLGTRWLEVGERMVSQEPVAGELRRDTSGLSTISVGGQSFSGRLASRDCLPLTDYERLVREISRVPGFEDVDAPPAYEDLREAAGGGPLVYLAATADGGFAVVVSEDALEPDVVSLPGITSHAVQTCAKLLLTAASADSRSAALEATLAWLRLHVIKPLASVLAPPALVTLVPVGALGLLPIHAAGMERTGGGSWRDRTGGLVFRYGPSGRLLARAQARASTEDWSEPSLVTLSARPAKSIEPVLGALGEATIWHIACRTEHDPLDPLSTRVMLADRSLPLPQLLAPDAGAPRLALLSACQTVIDPDTDLGDLVGIAAALVQAGVAGVVAPQGMMDGDGATLLSLGFLQRFLDGAEPARALAEAQRWLSAATNRELAEMFGALHPFPGDLRASEFREWERRREFAEPRHWAAFSCCGV